MGEYKKRSKPTVVAAKFNISLKHVDKVRSKERWKHT